VHGVDRRCPSPGSLRPVGSRSQLKRDPLGAKHMTQGPTRLAFVALVLTTSTVSAQASLAVTTGLRQYLSGSQERWPMVGLRVGLGSPSLRAELGAAAAVDLLYGGSETEIALGVVARVRRLGRSHDWTGNWGIGYSRLHADLGAGTGSSHAGYCHIGVHRALSPRRSLGVEIRYLTGPDRLRRDGFNDPVSFLQVGVVLEWGLASSRARLGA